MWKEESYNSRQTSITLVHNQVVCHNGVTLSGEKGKTCFNTETFESADWEGKELDVTWKGPFKESRFYWL